MKIVWTEPAILDLESIHTFIARDEEVYANAVLLEIINAVDQLIEFPKSGRKVPEQDNENIRELIVGNYRVIYNMGFHDIKIITILHCARRFHDTP